MKKIRNRNIKKSQKLKTPKTASLPISVPAISKSVRWPNVFYWAALILLTGFAIGLRIYKSHIAGISFDEAYTFIYYACDLEKALGSFSRINNHVFNSFLIYFAYKWFGNYEHFMRLPALVAGIWYILASIVLVHLTIQRKWLRFSVLGLLFFSVKVFEYTYLARGYSFMFAAITTQLVLVAYWSKHPIKASYWWLVVLLMSVMNFISFSSMLSAAFPLVAVNVTFIFLFSTHIYSPVPKYWKRVAIHLSGIFLLSTAFIALLFKNLLTAKGLFRVTRYNPKVTGINIPSYLHKMLVEEVFRPDDLLGNLLLWGVSALLVISVVWFARRVYLSVRQKQFKSLFFSNPAISYVTVVVLASFFMLFVFNIVLNKKLVHTRYHLYLLPLTTILFVIMLDSLISAIKSP
ncbi:MAG: hypothetical protein KAS23_06730, partial [Anaerohalosphaera sp.]|nr:hypothetical protein [Anaerohalosphaera sp.]